MSFPPSTHEHFSHMLERFDQARRWVDSALASIFESEMRALAKRFPSRRIELHSGMGTTQIRIDKRHPQATFDDWHWSNDYDDHEGQDWPAWLEEPAPDLWAAIRTYQDEVSEGKDPGLGTIIYENGKRISGLPEGGA
jgi:hypothetical protein